MRRKPKKESMVNMPLVNPNAAGIDVGDTIHAVAVPEGRDELREMTFGSRAGNYANPVQTKKPLQEIIL